MSVVRRHKKAEPADTDPALTSEILLERTSKPMIAEAQKTRKASYNPGSPAGIERINRDEFTVESFTSPDWYDVNIRTGTCSCPDYQRRRRKCKHQIYAEQVAYAAAIARAKQMTEDELLSAVPQLPGCARSSAKRPAKCSLTVLCDPFRLARSL